MNRRIKCNTIVILAKLYYIEIYILLHIIYTYSYYYILLDHVCIYFSQNLVMYGSYHPGNIRVLVNRVNLVLIKSIIAGQVHKKWKSISMG